MTQVHIGYLTHLSRILPMHWTSKNVRGAAAVLFVAQRFHGIQLCRLRGRVDAEE
jgi:hypothetical protein